MNNKGITLIALVITIIIMAILAGITVTTTNIVEEAQRQKTISDMVLIQTQVKIIMEKVTFNNDTSLFIGEKLAEAPDKAEIAGNALSASELLSDTYYIYDRETLESINLEGIALNNDEVYIVDYRGEGDVIVPKGVKSSSGNIVYRLSEVQD